jgi:hypoxanthine phosphoribosyltransferase
MQRVMEAKLTPYMSQEDIAAAVARLAAQLDLDYNRHPPVLVGILKGGFIFLADLIRQMKTPLQGVEFLQVASYGPGTVSSGRPRVIKGLPAKVIIGRHVIVVEDIVDTGVTTAFISCYLERRRPASLEVCALLDKPVRRQAQVCVKYVGFTVPENFLVGYGLDLDQRYRELPEIYLLEE